MAIYKIFPTADATIYSAYPAKNTGRDEILEVAVKNSGETLRIEGRGVLRTSPYYSYDAVTDSNYGTDVTGSDDIRRALLRFSDADIQTLKEFASSSLSSWEAKLRLYLAFAQNLSTDYLVEAYPVTQSWDMGTGKYSAVPEIRNGVNWIFTGQYSGSARWDAEGGSINVAYKTTQSFGYLDNKDVSIDVTNAVDKIFSGSIPNYGFLLKHTGSLEEDPNAFIDLKFFSVDTHTIYPPCLELRWDDCNYFPLGYNYVLSNDITIRISNMGSSLRRGDVYKVRTSVRDTYPRRTFTTSSVYLQPKYLSRETQWGLQDVKTNEMVVDFHSTYTRLSADNTSNYFYLYTTGLEPERFYRVLVKAKIYSTTFGPLSIYDDEQSIFDALSVYSESDLALLPAEEYIFDTGQVFKIVQ